MLSPLIILVSILFYLLLTMAGYGVILNRARVDV